MFDDDKSQGNSEFIWKAQRLSKTFMLSRQRQEEHQLSLGQY